MLHTVWHMRSHDLLAQITGDITYNGHTFNEFEVRRTAAYINQIDLHLPTLTVRETMDFAAMCMGEGFLPELLRRTKANEECAAPSIAHSCMHPWKPDDACGIVRRLDRRCFCIVSEVAWCLMRALCWTLSQKKWPRKGGRWTPTMSWTASWPPWRPTNSGSTWSSSSA